MRNWVKLTVEEEKKIHSFMKQEAKLFSELTDPEDYHISPDLKKKFKRLAIVYAIVVRQMEARLKRFGVGAE